MRALTQPVNKTLIYSDIFNYPLTLQEIHKYLITDKKINIDEISMSLKKNKKIKSKDGFYYLSGQEENVKFRNDRKKESSEKLKKAIEIGNKLKIIPSIKFLGISGSLSMMNAKKNDDIDLFVISENKSIWSTRFFIVIFLIISGVYRKKNDNHSANKFCLNMIIDSENIKLPKSRHDLYSAHEVVQVFPLFQRDNIYEKFIENNFWTKKYLANFEPVKLDNAKTNFITNLMWRVLKEFEFEKIIKFVQIRYMGRPKGLETISLGFLAFHPNDPRRSLLNTYKSRLKYSKATTLGH